jgi:SH3-like domain-containing protein
MKLYTGVLTFFAILMATHAYAERLAVSVPKANIRSGPGSEYGIIWNCEKFFPIQVVEKKGIWRRFKDFEGDEGWIHTSVVDKTPTVITVNKECNIRSGPGTNYDILFKVEKGVPFKVLKKKDAWIEIQHADGDKGWISQSLVW